MFQIPDVATFVQAAGLGFCEIGRSAFPAGTVRTLDMQQSRLQGFAALRAWADEAYVAFEHVDQLG